MSEKLPARGGITEDKMDQIERIKKMEALMDKVSAAVKDINKGLDDFNAVMEDVDTLEEY